MQLEDKAPKSGHHILCPAERILDLWRRRMRQSGGIVFAKQEPADQGIAGPFAAICFDAVDDAENQVHHPAARPENPNQWEQEHKGRRWIAELIIAKKKIAIEPMPRIM